MLREVVAGEVDGDLFLSTLSDGGRIRSRCVLCTTGVTWRRLEVPGVPRLLHAGIYYGAAISEAPGVEGKAVFVIGGGNAAGQAAMNFARLARSVTLVVRGNGLAASMSKYLSRRIDAAANVTVRTRTEVTAVDGEDWVRTLTLQHNLSQERDVVDAHAVFVCIGGVPHTNWLHGAGLVLDSAGYLVTGRDLQDPSLHGGRRPWRLERDPYPLSNLPPRGVSRQATCVGARPNGSPPRSVRAPWQSASSTASSPRTRHLTDGCGLTGSDRCCSDGTPANLDTIAPRTSSRDGTLSGPRSTPRSTASDRGPTNPGSSRALELPPPTRRRQVP